MALSAAGTAGHLDQHGRDGAGRASQLLPRAPHPRQRCPQTSAEHGISSTSSTRRAWAMPTRWHSAHRRCTRSRTHPSALPPGSLTTTTRATADQARVRRRLRRPDERRHPRQHHDVLADQHSCLVSSSLLGQPRNIHGRLLRREDVQVPVSVTVFPDEIYAAPRPGPTGIPQPDQVHTPSCRSHFAAWEQPQLLSRISARASARCVGSERAGVRSAGRAAGPSPTYDVRRSASSGRGGGIGRRGGLQHR